MSDDTPSTRLSRHGPARNDPARNDPDRRRAHLITSANPERGIEYLCSLRSDILAPRWHAQAEGDGGEGISVSLRYVPDRLILAPEGFAAYLPIAGGDCGATLESLAATILSDLANELVPRWIEVTLGRETRPGGGSELTHVVTLEDRQPGWSNRSLEARLGLS